MAIWDELKHFKKSEFGKHADKMQPELLKRLDKMRSLYGKPIKVTSAWRDVGPTDPPEHEQGYAVDIACADSGARLHMVEAALKAGFRRIGLYDKHAHLGCSPTLPGEVLWLGGKSH